MDGRPRPWAEIGRLLFSYEGRSVSIEISDLVEQLPLVLESGTAQLSGGVPH